jgi:hypothetical protein
LSYAKGGEDLPAYRVACFAALFPFGRGLELVVFDQRLSQRAAPFLRFARPERFELPTLRFEVAKMIL